MFRVFRAAVAVIVGVLLAVTLVGFTPGGESEAKATLGPVQGVTVAAADFHPTEPRLSELAYQNQGHTLFFDGLQTAGVPIPADEVVITWVKLWAFDNYEPGDLCVGLFRARPAEAGWNLLGSQCTSGASSEDPQTLTMKVFKRVGRYHTVYLRVSSDWNDLNLRLYGATVLYRVVT